MLRACLGLALAASLAWLGLLIHRDWPDSALAHEELPYYAQAGSSGVVAHTDRAFLIDSRRRIRGIYDAASAHEMQRLRGDVDRLRAEDTRERGG